MSDGMIHRTQETVQSNYHGLRVDSTQGREYATVRWPIAPSPRALTDETSWAQTVTRGPEPDPLELSFLCDPACLASLLFHKARDKRESLRRFVPRAVTPVDGEAHVQSWATRVTHLQLATSQNWAGSHTSWDKPPPESRAPEEVGPATTTKIAHLRSSRQRRLLGRLSWADGID